MKTEETVKCTNCGSHGPHTWYEEIGEWIGEDFDGYGMTYCHGWAECIVCGHKQKIQPHYIWFENGETRTLEEANA
jgi:hypothetical protein